MPVAPQPSLADTARPPQGREVPARYIRPLACREVRGLAWVGPDLLVLDSRTGRVALVDPRSDDTRVVNDGATEGFVGARGLAVADGWLWFTSAEGVRRAAWGSPADWDPARPEPTSGVGAGVVVLETSASAVAVHADRLYLVVGHELREHALVDGTPSRHPLRVVTLHGVGGKALSATPRHLWLCDDVEQTVYCLDRATLGSLFTVVTPLEGPTAVVATDPGDGRADQVHVAYYEDEPFLKDNPWIDPCWEVRYRDRALVHQLHVLHDPRARRAWSTGHRMVMHYYVEVSPRDDVGVLSDVQWRMSLPLDTARQRVVDLAPIGLPFEVVDEPDGLGAPQRVAVFDLPQVDAGTRVLLGWRATLEVFGIKHLVAAEDLAEAPALDASLRRYLVDDEDLDLDTPEIAAATAAAVGDEGNAVLAARQIRSWVYDRLEYAMGNADSPVVVLARGTGSCGEYVSTIMALLRRAGIPCRVAGRYKCPYAPWSGAPLYPDFNHVWVDVHLPGFGWVPVESNPDDVADGGPYPDRFFLGLPWRHVEVGKDISFEKVLATTASGRRRRIGPRRLSSNHIRFDVLCELAPVGAAGQQPPP